jgi:hypothetical protein
MADLPRLKTGAVTQYPAQKAICYSTHILRFADGSEQRFREYSSALRRWTVQLDLLDEVEMSQIESFFLSQQGVFGSFSFVDPWEEVEYANCSLENAELVLKFLREGRGQAILRIQQNRT